MQKFKIWLLFLTTTIVAYATSLKYGFSQDDWYFLLISRAHNITDVFNFFNPWTQSGFAFYRPLGTQLYYYLLNNPFYMHILMLLIQSISGYLVYLLVKKLKVNEESAKIIGVSYTISSASFLSLFYIAATQQLLAAMFGLLSLNLFLSSKRWLSALFFCFALLSKEIAIMIPPIAFILNFVLKNRFRLGEYIPYSLVAIAYVMLRLFSPHVIQSEYQFVFGLTTLSNIRWYYLFAYGAPENILNYATSSIGINFYKYFLDFGLRGVVIVFGFIVLTIISIFNFFQFHKLRQNILCLSWFIIALLPIIFLKDHRYPHYVDIALIPLLLLLFSHPKVWVQRIVFSLYILTSLLSINLSEHTHWTTGRAIMMSKARNALNWQDICRQKTIIFVGDAIEVRELSYTLSLANGPKVICNNPNLGVYYKDIDTNIKEDAYKIDVGPVFK